MANKEARQQTKDQAFADYLKAGEQAAYYMHGLADGIEAMAHGDATERVTRHLRHHADELNLGTLWVEHGYTPDRPGRAKL